MNKVLTVEFKAIFQDSSLPSIFDGKRICETKKIVMETNTHEGRLAELNVIMKQWKKEILEMLPLHIPDITWMYSVIGEHGTMTHVY